jgi:hypothetical protein
MHRDKLRERNDVFGSIVGLKLYRSLVRSIVEVTCLSGPRVTCPETNSSGKT